jgi:hypothetical protein
MIPTNTISQTEPHTLFLNEDIFDKIGALALGAISTGIISVNGPKLMITAVCCYILFSAIKLQQQAETIKTFSQASSQTPSTPQNATETISVGCQNCPEKATKDSSTQTTNQDKTTIEILEALIEAKTALIKSLNSEISRNQQAKKSSSPAPIPPQRHDKAPPTHARILKESLQRSETAKTSAPLSLQGSDTTTASPSNNIITTTTSKTRLLNEGKKRPTTNPATNLPLWGIPYGSKRPWQ